MALYDTVLNVVSDACLELGLKSSALSAVAASTDPVVVMVRAHLKSRGKRLALEYPWRHLTKEHTFTTTSATTYALPADFSSMVDQTAWDRTQDSPLAGPADPQTWQYLAATNLGTQLAITFRPRESTLEVWPQPPTAGLTIAFEYASRYWVQGTGQAAPDKDAVSADTDTLKFDSVLLVKGIKLDWKRAKGQDSSIEQQDYDETLELVKAASTAAAPVLDLNGRDLRDRLIDFSNAGNTGFGLGEGGLF